MSKNNEKPAKKFPTQASLTVTRAEATMLWQLVNATNVAVHPSEGAVAGQLHAKVRMLAESVGVGSALAPPKPNAPA